MLSVAFDIQFASIKTSNKVKLNKIYIGKIRCSCEVRIFSFIFKISVLFSKTKGVCCAHEARIEAPVGTIIGYVRQQ